MNLNVKNIIPSIKSAHAHFIAADAGNTCLNFEY